MFTRLNIVALFLVLSQCLWLNLAHAETSISPVVSEQVMQKTDAIQQFVSGDFSARRALLNRWPASIELLDQLATYVEKDQLYTDSTGQTYILEGQDQLRRYADQTLMSTWPADITQVTLVNTLRKALSFAQAQKKLSSTNASQRLEAIDILENNLDELDVKQINQLYLAEQNNSVKARLAQLKARLDYQNPDVLIQIQAVKVLQDSNRPDVLAMVETELQQPNLHPELKLMLTDAKSQIKTRIQASEWTGHVFSGLSTASILLLAALGLAITYGLLGVINMAHGELIMIGAYTTYVVQSLFKTYLGGSLLPYQQLLWSVHSLAC